MNQADDLMRRGGPRLVNEWLELMRIFRRPRNPIAPSSYWRWDGIHLSWMPKGRTMMKLWVMNGWVTENPNVSQAEGTIDVVGHDQEVDDD